MALFATETWTMRHRLLLTIGAILVVCQLISVFWLWHESKEQIQLLVASPSKGTTTRNMWSMRYGKRLPACWCRAC